MSDVLLLIKRSLMNLYLKVFENNELSYQKDNSEFSIKELDEMFYEIKNTTKVFQPSNFWDKYAKEHIKKLEKYGIANFKRTLGMQYFHFPPFPDRSFQRIFLKWLRHPGLKIFSNLNSRLGTTEYMGHNISLDGILGIYCTIYVRVFYELTKRKDTKNLLSKLEEPLVGNPIKINYDNKIIGFDICNSLLEYYAMSDVVGFSKKDTSVICELGAGYGRLAYVLMKIHPNYKYVIFDIPPALYVSQVYLSKLFPEKRIFKFRHFRNFSEIKKEYNESGLCFFTPNQLEFFPENEVDVFINISSLHEMRKDQIEKYHELINKVTDGYFFSKQYPDIIRLGDELTGAYEVPFDKYPIPKNWKLIFKKIDELNPRFVEAMYYLEK